MNAKYAKFHRQGLELRQMKERIKKSLAKRLKKRPRPKA
jgi:hypothetical protein